MTIRENTIRPDLIRNHECDFGTSIAKSLWSKMANYHNWTNSNIPIGYVLFFYESQTYAEGSFIEKPNPELWHPLDGSTIVDEDSPLNGLTTKDMANTFLKGGLISGISGGQPTIDISHNHTGKLVPANSAGSSNAMSGGDYRGGTTHTHDISTELTKTESFIPPFLEIHMYIRKK